MEDIAGGRYHFIVDRSGGDEWATVYGGGLPMAVGIRVGQAPDGRFVFTGLRLGVDDGPREVTSQVLRDIRLADVLADFYDTFRPDLEAEMLASLAEVSSPLPPQGRGRPTEQQLKAFAATYLSELAREPHRAMTAAAAANSISRATANRWAALCRKYGYLPAAAATGPPS